MKSKSNDTSAINIQVDSDVKKEATSVLTDLGLSMSSAINLFLKQVVKHNGIPFAVTNVAPNSDLSSGAIFVSNFSPRSFLIFLIMSGRLLGHKSRSISGSSIRSLFIYLKNGRFHLIGSSCVTPKR